MSDTVNPTPAVMLGPITFEDVRQALGDVDPNTTNANALRDKLGRRGSLATIQKHLVAIRAERAPAPFEPGAIPSPSPEAVASIWSVVWTHVQAQALGRLERVTAQRDACEARVTALEQDMTSTAGALDKLEADLAQAQVLTQTAELTLTQAQAAAQDAAAAAAAELAQTRAELASTVLAAKTAADLAARDAQLLTQTHQVDREHLLGQVATLMSLVHRPTPAASA